MELPTVTVDDLRQFHAKHFPTAPIPQEIVVGAAADNEALDEHYMEEDDGLGYYEDGVKRTLTDEQIALFRHTEIQMILRERRRKREAAQSSGDDGSVDLRPGHEGKTPAANTSSTTQHIKPLDKVHDGRVEKNPSGSRWVYSSEKTKDRQRRKNKKYRLNRQKRKREEKKKLREASAASDGASEKDSDDDDDEGNEWDPRRQATGPDVPKDPAIDLDY